MPPRSSSHASVWRTLALTILIGVWRTQGEDEHDPLWQPLTSCEHLEGSTRVGAGPAFFRDAMLDQGVSCFSLTQNLELTPAEWGDVPVVMDRNLSLTFQPIPEDEQNSEGNCTVFNHGEVRFGPSTEENYAYMLSSASMSWFMMWHSLRVVIGSAVTASVGDADRDPGSNPKFAGFQGILAFKVLLGKAENISATEGPPRGAVADKLHVVADCAIQGDITSGLILLLLKAWPGFGAVDPNAPLLAQQNRNGDVVLRNVALPVINRDNERFYVKSLVLSCMGKKTRFPPPELTVSHQCYEPYAQHHVYQGRVAITKSGKPCKRWDEMDPEEDFTPWQYPTAHLESNYCRTPDVNFRQEEPSIGTPWCYTDSDSPGTAAREECDIPVCSQCVNGGVGPNVTASGSHGGSVAVIPAAVGGGVAALVLLALVAIPRVRSGVRRVWRGVAFCDCCNAAVFTERERELSASAQAAKLNNETRSRLNLAYQSLLAGQVTDRTDLVQSRLTQSGFLPFVEKQTSLQSSDQGPGSVTVGIDVSQFAERGKVISGYMFLGTLGEGMQGCVYLVEHVKTGLLYAAKKHTREMQEACKLFLCESFFLSLLEENPLVVQVVDMFIHENSMYMIMEYCSGGTMQEYLEKLVKEGRRLDRETAEYWLVQLIVGMAGMHRQRVLHRDLKPSNIMMLANGKHSAQELRLGDFGSAKMVLDHTQTFIGTPLFMAPEVLNMGPYSAAADVWSIGSIIYLACMGKLPFDNNAADLTELRENVTNGELDPIPEEIWGPDLVSIVHSMLNQHDAAQRPTLEDLLTKNQWIAQYFSSTRVP
eukprot:CAMPEP_0118924928 /NCGR_PEP_ID=MMETSP1169-20130426/2856_1 /TAXON_ID=36882 /ORGANISM="Pyramimonas obovata, Strain CCMP722" /LENGTH=818 /DNA_ID=CAMNT_0006866081 /DNA_START=157 /DNA_END=2613 /DNA_ORIENTATION=+